MADVTRILAWANPYWPAIGGGPRLGSSLFPALAALGHDIIVLADRRPPELPEEERHDGVRVIRLPFRRALGGSISELLKIRRTVMELKEAFRPQVVHLFTLGYAEVFHYETDKDRLPMVATLHRLFPLASYAEDGIIGRTLRNADRVTACSRFILESTCAVVPELRGRALAIPNSLPSRTVPFTPSPRSSASILCLGVAEHRKGFDIALAAFASLRRRHPDLRMVIAGDGAAMESLAAQALNLGIRDSVSLRGRIEPEEVPALVDEATVVVMPSREEPFGLVALEAALAGRPIVASNTGGLPEIVADGETGFLVPVEDTAAIAAAVSTLLDDPARAIAMGRAARLRATQLFAWDPFVAAHDSVIRQVARN